MRYCEITAVCEAKRMFEPFVVESPHGLQQGNVGDFVLRTIDGHYFVCDQATFYKTYQWIQTPSEQGGYYVTSQPITTKKHN